MAKITLKGNPIKTAGKLPKVGKKAPGFKLTKSDLSTAKLKDYKGSKVILNIFPSLDTGTCAASVRKFNEEAAKLENTNVLCISRDLPFAQQQFCAADGLEDVVMLSDFKTGQFGKDYGALMTTGGFDGLLSRAVIVVNKEGKVVYSEQVPEIGQEPDYEKALEAVNALT